MDGVVMKIMYSSFLDLNLLVYICIYIFINFSYFVIAFNDA